MVWIAFVFMGYGLDCHALLRKARNDRESSKASNDKTRFVDCFASLAMTERVAKLAMIKQGLWIASLRSQ